MKSFERTIGVAVVVTTVVAFVPLLVYDSLTDPSWWRWLWVGALIVAVATLARYLWRTRRRTPPSVDTLAEGGPRRSDE